MVGIGVGSGVGSVSGVLPGYSRARDVGRCPPPKRGLGGTLKAWVMLCMPLEPSTQVSSGDEKGDIGVVCNDGIGIFVGWLHGRGHVLRGLKGPLWIMMVVIVKQVAVANLASLSRACWARPLRGALTCPWPSGLKIPV